MPFQRNRSAAPAAKRRARRGEQSKAAQSTKHAPRMPRPKSRVLH